MKFGSWNIVEPEQLPPAGTNYMVTDPADVRPFFTIWLRVPPGDPQRPELYIYRDWPDEQTFGEWATATERETSEDSRKGWDGDRGPAQANPGLGTSGYKRVWLDKETVTATSDERDPYRRHLQEEARRLGQPRQEFIFARKIDPRAAPREHITESGGTCLLWDFAKEDEGEAGAMLPAFDFEVAPGNPVAHGITLINELLEWHQERPLLPPLNAPRLFVSSECRQVIWALSHYTGKAGEQGASKDVIDDLRMAAESDLQYVDEQTLGSRGGGSY
jgi:hypothetical protein